MAVERPLSNLHQAPRDRNQVIVSAEIEQRRNKVRIELQQLRFGASHARHAQRRVAIERFAFRQKAEILVRHLHVLFGKTRVFVAEGFVLGRVARRGVLARRIRHVQSAVAVMRHGEMDI